MKAADSTRDRADRTRVLANQVELLYRQAPLGIMATIVIGSILAYELHSTAKIGELVVFWTLLMVSVSLGRYVLVLAYKRAHNRHSDSQAWLRRFAIGAMAAGVTWGFAGAVFFPGLTDEQQVFLAFVLAGMTAGGLPLFSAVWWVYALFAAGIILPFEVVLLTFGSRVFTELSFMLPAFFAINVSVAYRLHQMFVSGFRDVSKRVATHARLVQSERRYHQLFNSIDEGYCVVEMIFDERQKPIDYRFLEVNAAFEQQTGLRDATGKRMRELAPNLEAHWFETYGKVALTGEPVRLVHRAKELDDRWFDLYAFRLGGSDSRKVAIVFDNITDRLRADKALKESEERYRTLFNSMAALHRQKDEFLAMLSHELRNPLAALWNAAQVLRLKKLEDPLQQQACGIVERQVGNLKHLVDDLLEVSRLTTGRVRLRQEATAIADIVKSAVETAEPLITARKHALTVSLSDEPAWVHGDAGRLEQVVINLLTNAAKYTPEGGRIWLKVVQQEGVIRLTVRDTGVGISEELLPHVFELFTQAERSLDRAEGGLGIGLSLVQRLVELHGGQVTVTSQVGKGSEFVVQLPLIEAPLATSGTVQARPPAAPVGRKKACRVLVVDDNVDGAQVLKILLTASGHEARTAHDGLSALDAAFEFVPDVVLLDIGLPGLDGYEVAKRLRGHPPLQGVMLVAMTGYGQDSDRQRAEEAGLDHHLVKPADFNEVEKLLATVA